jgi:hypothetical protein
MLRWFRRRREGKKAERDRENALREMLLKRDGKRRDSEAAKKAVAYCEYCINVYEGWFDWNEGRWLRWQKVVIVGGVVATLAGVITIPESWISVDSGWRSLTWLRGVPPAIVTIAASFLSSFTYREDAVRHELTASSLWNELVRYQSGAAPYTRTQEEDTSLFVNTICRIVEIELRDWSALVAGNRDAPKTDGENKPVAGGTGHRTGGQTKFSRRR